jgi:hypothetical protein
LGLIADQFQQKRKGTKMSVLHAGGCLCGDVRFETQGDPEKTALCHCRYCQLRTGSAFGVSVYFDQAAVTLRQGQTKTYTFQTESGRDFTTEFCVRCGTTVFWRLELFPGKVGVAGGAFDPPSFWYDVSREVFVRNKAPFANFCLNDSHATSSSFDPKKEEDARMHVTTPL